MSRRSWKRQFRGHWIITTSLDLHPPTQISDYATDPLDLQKEIHSTSPLPPHTCLTSYLDVIWNLNFLGQFKQGWKLCRAKRYVDTCNGWNGQLPLARLNIVVPVCGWIRTFQMRLLTSENKMLPLQKYKQPYTLVGPPLYSFINTGKFWRRFKHSEI